MQQKNNFTIMSVQLFSLPRTIWTHNYISVCFFVSLLFTFIFLRPRYTIPEG